VRFVFLYGNSGYAIANQRLFHNYDFFAFFINIFIGFYSFIIRISFSVVHALLWLSRLDKCALPRGYETEDPGYRTYVGFLLLDYQYSNPVVLTFIQMLQASTRAVNKTRQLFFKSMVQECGLWDEDTLSQVRVDSGCCRFFLSFFLLVYFPNRSSILSETKKAK
jgi:hypothetical protein